MPVAQINGQNLYFEDTATEKPVVVFSHGLLMDHTMFAPQIEAISDHWRCIAWDERGHGRTSGDAKLAPFTYWDSADDLHGLLAYLGVHRAVLVGMSQGGFLSLRATLRYPDLVRALVLIDSQAGPESPESQAGNLGLADQWASQGATSQILDAIEHILFGPGFSEAGLWREKWSRIRIDDLQTCLATLGDREDLTSRLGEIHVPALVIHGDADSAIPFALGEKLAHGLRAKLLVVPGGGHSPNLTHPEMCNAALTSFLGSL